MEVIESDTKDTYLKLSKNEAGIVLDEKGEIQIILPVRDDDEPVSLSELFVAAIAVRAEDEEWVMDLVDDFCAGQDFSEARE